MVNFLRSSKGSTMILVSLFALLILFAIAAFAIDIGYAYSERAKMVTAADAAALAGASVLSQPSATVEEVEEAAFSIAEDNGVERDRVQVQVDLDAREVEVSVTETKGLFFARIMGSERIFQEADIGAVARAAVETFTGGSGVVPIGVTKSDMESIEIGSEVLIKLGPGDGENGNYHALNMNIINGVKQGYNSGADFYKQCFKYGSPCEVKIGDTIDPEKGNMAGPTVESVKYRIENGLSRIIVPVVDGFNKNDPCKVIGFALFNLVGYEEKGNKKGEVWGYFEEYYDGESQGINSGYGGNIRLIK